MNDPLESRLRQPVLRFEIRLFAFRDKKSRSLQQNAVTRPRRHRLAG
jgi:hypothetical protein